MGKTWLYILLALLPAWGVQAQSASKLMREGVLSYKKGDYTQAISRYKAAMNEGMDRNLANYNMGGAFYKAGKADSALNYWQSVATSDKDKDLQAKSWYNMGNAFVKQGNFAKAQEAYQNALRINPKDEDARYNLAYTKRRLEQQQQKQPQQSEQKKDKQEIKEEPKQQNSDQPDKNLNKEEAERILNALDNKEKDLQNKKKVKAEPGTPSKDW